MIVNRVDVDKFRETVEKAKKDPSTGKKTMEIEGEWRIDKTGPQFESKIKREAFFHQQGPFVESGHIVYFEVSANA